SSVASVAAPNIAKPLNMAMARYRGSLASAVVRLSRHRASWCCRSRYFDESRAATLASPSLKKAASTLTVKPTSTDVNHHAGSSRCSRSLFMVSTWLGFERSRVLELEVSLASPRWGAYRFYV